MGRLTSAELEAVRQAVVSAEGQTAGEIVPYVVGRSGGFEIVIWRGALTGAALMVGVLLLARIVATGWSTPALHSAYAPHLAGLLGAGFGLLSGRFVPAVYRMLAGARHLDRVVHERAVRAFLDEEVFDTRDRTGIVILVSLLERRIEVLGDAGINAAVDREEWADVVGIIREGLKAGRLADALVEGIARCGELLSAKGVERRSDDRNELTDTPRISGA